MKILLITTGGTIASIIDDSVIDVKPQGRLLILEKYKEIDKDTQFDVISPINILSENVSFSDYKKLLECLSGVCFENYDGVIITHGSDTLSYTSALVGLILSDINKPVMIIAADKSLQDEKSNGLDNFICAVEMIKNKKCGVFVPYKNTDGVTYIHYATQLMESPTFSDDFYSISGAYAVYKKSKIVELNNTVNNPVSVKLADIERTFKKNVLQLRPYPGLNYNKVNLENIDAVLHYTYHAGSVCANASDEYCVTKLIKKCKEASVPFYICGVKSNKENYHSLTVAEGMGAKVLYDMSPSCAYMKLLLEG